MKRIIMTGLAMAAVTLATGASAEATFYEHDGFAGRNLAAQGTVPDFRRFGFDDMASSVSITRTPWEVCQGVGFQGRCVVLRPGNYPSLSSMGLDDRISSAREVSRNGRIDDDRYAPAPLPPQAVFFEREGFQGPSFTADRDVGNFRRFGFNDRASSAIVQGSRWEVCEDVRFSGRCVILRPGRYASLADMGLEDRISSVRQVEPHARYDDRRYAPAPQPVYDARRRENERLYEVNVTSARAIVATPNQRCWVDRDQVSQDQGNRNNVGGAIVGAVLGGILGHQVGGGSGKDLATVGGAVAGAAIGSNVGGRNDPQAATQDVRHCENVPSQAHPEYWDVTYMFRGQEHHVQMTTQPGPTITVNEQGEPRV